RLLPERVLLRHALRGAVARLSARRLAPSRADLFGTLRRGALRCPAGAPGPPPAGGGPVPGLPAPVRDGAAPARAVPGADATVRSPLRGAVGVPGAGPGGRRGARPLTAPGGGEECVMLRSGVMCAICGTPGRADARFCAHCGAPAASRPRTLGAGNIVGAIL